jgi:hypothetical protein
MLLQDLEGPPASVTADTVLECLRRVEVPSNVTRLNVRPVKNVAIRSTTFGLVSLGSAPARISRQTVAGPVLARVLGKFGRKVLPADFDFTSVALNAHYGSAMHVDERRGAKLEGGAENVQISRGHHPLDLTPSRNDFPLTSAPRSHRQYTVDVERSSKPHPSCFNLLLLREIYLRRPGAIDALAGPRRPAGVGDRGYGPRVPPEG